MGKLTSIMDGAVEARGMLEVRRGEGRERSRRLVENEREGDVEVVGRE